MPLDLSALCAPAHTAIVTQECQGAVIGAESALPQLAAEASKGMIPAIRRLVDAGRSRGVQVVHCVNERRADGKGANTNARLFMAMRKSPVDMLPGRPGSQVVPEIGVADDDLVLSRMHGLGPMAGTDLDPVLRNLGVTTVIGVGVSVNIGMTNFAMDAVNWGYQFVLPRDAVAGIPASYADAVIDNTLSLFTTVTSVDEIVAAWT